MLSAPFLMFPTVRPCWTAVALAVLAAWWLLRWGVRREPWPMTPFNGALLLFVLMIPVAVRLSVAPEFTIPESARIILGLAVFRLLCFLAASRRIVIVAVTGFCLGGLVATIIGVLAIQWPESKVGALSNLTVGIPRWIPVLPEDQGPPGVHPNQLAAILTIFLPLATTLVSGWPYGKLTWRRVPLLIIAMAFLLLTGGTLLLTQSRSGWIGGLAGLVGIPALWGMVLRRSWRKWVAWGIVAVLIAIPLAWAIRVGPEGLSRLWENPSGETVIGSLNTLAFRQEVWRWALVGIQDFPFTGCGLGAFRRVARILYPLDPSRVSPTYDIAHAHNIFLQTALDVGIPGLIAYLALLFIAGAVCWRAARRGDPLTRPMAIGLAAGLLALHAYGMTDALALGSKPAVVFWFALGLVAALEGAGQGDKPSNR